MRETGFQGAGSTATDSPPVVCIPAPAEGTLLHGETRVRTVQGQRGQWVLGLGWNCSADADSSSAPRAQQWD